MQQILITLAKTSITITSSNLILHSFLGCTTRIYCMRSLIYIKPYSPFHGNDKIILLTNLFQHLLSAEILSVKIEFILPYLVRNFQINAKNKLTTKCLLTFIHYTRAHLEYGS